MCSNVGVLPSKETLLAGPPSVHAKSLPLFQVFQGRRRKYIILRLLSNPTLGHKHLMVTPLYILRIYSLKEILLTTYVANIFSMSPGLTLQTMGYTLSVIQLVNFGTRYQTHSEPLLRPMLLN